MIMYGCMSLHINIYIYIIVHSLSDFSYPATLMGIFHAVSIFWGLHLPIQQFGLPHHQ